jgi:hypothetical protein
VPHSGHQHSDRNVLVADRVLEIVRAPEGEQGITSGALCAARNFSRSPRLPQGYSKGTPLIVLFQQQVQIMIDPVGLGIVESLSRPGGNITGFTQFEYSIPAKWLELLKEIAPDTMRAAVLRDPFDPAGVGQWAAMQSVASVFAVELRVVKRSRQGRN